MVSFKKEIPFIIIFQVATMATSIKQCLSAIITIFKPGLSSTWLMSTISFLIYFIGLGALLLTSPKNIGIGCSYVLVKQAPRRMIMGPNINKEA